MSLEQFIQSLPNFAGTMPVNGTLVPYSNLELSKPTGKYIARSIIKLLNVLLAKKYVRYIGHSCAPGLYKVPLDPTAGFAQFEDEVRKCGVVVANIEGQKEMKEAISIEAEPFMKIDIRENWLSFNDYLGSMSSKYRTRTRRVYALSASLTFKKLEGYELDQALETCAGLLLETLRHKTLTLGKDLTLLLKLFQGYWGKNFGIHAYFIGDELIGFISYIEFNKEIYAMHLGYKMEQGTAMHIYQRMMYDLIQYGIEKKCTLLHLGRTATEIKSTLGATPIENTLVFYTRNSFLKILLKTYKSNFYKPPIYTLRHPFKEA